MIRRPGEFHLAPFRKAPVPSKILWRRSAMRKTLSGREPIEDTIEQSLCTTRAQLGHRRVNRGSIVELWVRRAEPLPRILAIIPHVFGSCDHTGEPFGALTFRRSQSNTALECCFWNNFDQELVCRTSLDEHTADSATQRLLWKTPFNYTGEIPKRFRFDAKYLGNTASFNHTGSL